MLNITEIKPEIEKLAKKYRLSMIVLFGSQVSGKTHPQSDFDFAFLSEKKNEPDWNCKDAVYIYPET